MQIKFLTFVEFNDYNFKLKKVLIVYFKELRGYVRIKLKENKKILHCYKYMYLKELNCSFYNDVGVNENKAIQ